MSLTLKSCMCMCDMCVYVYIYIYFSFAFAFFLNSPILGLYFMSVMSSTILSTLLSFMNFSTMPFIASCYFGDIFLSLVERGFSPDV